MSLLARSPLPLALVAGLLFGSGSAPAHAGSPPSTTSSLGEAFGSSSLEQIALVDHLRSQGVTFYGAFWCQACFKQKVLFGKEAGNRLPYVECAKEKDAAGAQACSAADVLAYPTWVMGNERRVGVQSLQELAIWTQFKGPANFRSGKPGL
ncbi:MAG: hypothetical protein VKJ05_09415 [Synechococcaceae cyanobacterium]|nr:hypothetical protein [Synechococcaceae cyanobacterium]